MLRFGVSSISDLVAVPGLINLDLADVRRVMTNAGICHMGIGQASGEGRAATAIRQAINSPLLDTTIDGARGVIINFTGGRDMKLREIDDAASQVRDAVAPEADIIFGAVIDENMSDEIMITVIASGFDHEGRPQQSASNQAGFSSFHNRDRLTERYNSDKFASRYGQPKANRPTAPAQNQTRQNVEADGGFGLPPMLTRTSPARQEPATARPTVDHTLSEEPVDQPQQDKFTARQEEIADRSAMVDLVQKVSSETKPQADALTESLEDEQVETSTKRPSRNKSKSGRILPWILQDEDDFD